MKKRKELNALIGLAADGRRKKPAKKGSGHRLLRTEPPASDSESSSEEDEFAGARGRCGKGDYLRCCKFCYPLCAFVILAACVIACVGLVWMQVALKEDLDAIKEKFRTMESNQKTSFQEIPKLNEDLVQKQKQLEQIETGELGLNKIWINITEINKQTVANIGSTLTSVSHDVENIQTAIEEYKKSIEILQNDVKELKQIPSLPSTVVPRTERNQTENCKKVFFSLARGILLQVSLESQSLHAALEELNNTVVVYQKLNDIKLLNVDSAIGNLSRRIMLLENSPLAVNNLDKRENLSTNLGNDATTSLKVENEDQLDNETHSNKELKETGARDSQVSKLKEKLQLISALTAKPENDKPIETSKNVESSLSTTAKPTDLSRLASRSADDITESNGQLRHLSLPGISSIRDLQNLFEKATEDTDGKLSYEDLQKLLGSTAQESQSFKKFDTDGDEKYSLQELRLALGV
ncbi:EF-hand calcium-binding domain-containing protein 14 isoform X4 [Aquila chrysaetos chrysaetos]|uniref:EF-hand calcium-binding domain-containing protein 14 isoform X4 n=1 Tax=Aquila chrysaetos chrysaetos TaxID=223781 RepID=UPI001B7D30A6|nr:EF-hand calcium-binding domain-containing protein 14 isoform X4 [Aquila chrysaetos chrysaetos]